MTEASQVGEARRAAAALARALGFDETGCGQVALVVTEAATNLVKHARDGAPASCGRWSRTRRSGIEILALDKGPGMADLGRCLRDGFSTAGTPGHRPGGHRPPVGLRRHLLRLPAAAPPCWPACGRAHAPAGERALRRSGRSASPMAGETVCGDAWAVDDA